VRVPGDKSIGHRSVILSALCEGESHVSGLSGGEDNLRTVAVFQALGVAIEPAGAGALRVRGVGLDGLRAAAQPLDCGNSGTSMRLLTGLLAGQPFDSTLDGDEYLRVRPMARVAGPVTRMGARVTGEAGRKPGEVYPPLRIEGRRPLGGLDHESAVASAQIKSALLLAGLYADAPVRVREPGPSRDHTERMLRALGVPVRAVAPGQVELDPRGFTRRLAARNWVVPGDISSAAFPLVAALLVPGSEITVNGVGLNPTRTGVLDALRAMGADLTVHDERDEGGEPVGSVTVRSGPLRAALLAGDVVVRAIDEIPILAVAAARAHGTTVVRDAAELRVKESDRIAMIVRQLDRLGVPVREHPDGLEVTGPVDFKAGVTCESGGDHRIAMACAVAALAAAGPVEVTDVDNIATSFPGFAELMAQIGAVMVRS
jgi:3-phosphoshikimate 1-carboxyvinyltransferase